MLCLGDSVLWAESKHVSVNMTGRSGIIKVNNVFLPQPGFSEAEQINIVIWSKII